MKYLIAVLFACLALASAEEYRIRNSEDLMKARKDCVEAKKVPAAHIEKYKKFDFPDDETTRCYLQCILEKFQLFDVKTGFNQENLLKQLGQNKDANTVKTDIEACADKNDQKSDSCTWAYRGFKCFLTKNLQLVQDSLKKN